ncbi:MAG: efflux RND transporter periplasmic adaptor subunit [Croceitalea sp.]|nr:efflux RND transporter periplasmic adaptor subunit [Croceitalea sp.]MBT8237684.1 efflux RND transporter periplasmic adaptor subunit [Croceitalea sp.]NNC34942.1 efflux RND transporter periplasmic adaptor subunit [Croceitalea sp.]NNL09924.1 efflux RND transporter periplasmic adaptor subunit [Croceitalea sp.]NNM18312.1 efflux RND transporter periplasmic adaptor subunit [Croceitalea sp.]
MKQLFSIIIPALILSSCGGGTQTDLDGLLAAKDIEAIRAKRIEIETDYKALGQEIALLDSAISELDGSSKLPLVTTIVAQYQKFDHYLDLQGDVMTKQNVLIYPEMAGTLYKVYVKEGQKVVKGQLLASIDDGGLSSQLAQLKTQAELAKTTFERQKRLWEQNIGSEIQYLQAKTNYEAQENAVKQLQSQLGKSTIRAPFSGIIDDVIKDQGTVVSPGPGSEVFRIVNLGNMYIEVEVPESHLPNVTPGKDVIVHFPILGDSVSTKVRQTGNFINPSNRSFTAEIPLPINDTRIKPNLTAKVMINDYTNEKAILIPQSIVSENAAGEQYVYVIEGNGEGDEAMAKKSIIETGKTQGDFVEVLSGINEGDGVINEGARSVKEGQKVKIKN